MEMQQPHKKSIWNSGLEIDKNDFTQLFSACVGWVLHTQMMAAELVVAGQDWNIDFELGALYFGQNKYLLQLIGSEATHDNTWLWGWANPSDLPPFVLEDSQKLRLWGQQNNLSLFTEEEHPLDDVRNGHTLSIITTALADEPACYYRAVHDGGAVFVSFTGVPADVFAPVTAQRFASIVQQIIGQFAVHHKTLVQSFLYQNGTPYAWQGNRLLANFANEAPLEIRFDDLGRIAGISFSAQG